MPKVTHQYIEFWISEHRVDGLVVFNQQVSLKIGWPDHVFLYVVERAFWRKYLTKEVRPELIVGAQFDERNGRRWKSQIDGHWDRIFSELKIQNDAELWNDYAAALIRSAPAEMKDLVSPYRDHSDVYFDD